MIPLMDEVECCWHLYADNGQRVIGMHVGFSAILTSLCRYTSQFVWNNRNSIIIVHYVHCNAAYHCWCSLVHSDNEWGVRSVCVCVCSIAGSFVGLLDTWFSDGPGGKSVSQSGGTVHKQPCGTCWTVEGQMGGGRDEHGRKRCWWLYASNMYYRCPPKQAVIIF